MRKTTLSLSILLSLLVLFISCEKQKEKTWTSFYDFTVADIAGSYVPNPDESVYEESPTDGMTVYDNASLTITELSDNNISVRIIIPDEINKVFTGNIEPNNNLAIIKLTQGLYESFTANVYKDSQNQIRLSGYESRSIYGANSELVDKKVYGFDVIKIEDRRQN